MIIVMRMMIQTTITIRGGDRAVSVLRTIVECVYASAASLPHPSHEHCCSSVVQTEV